jgi:hypothetical protein
LAAPVLACEQALQKSPQAVSQQNESTQLVELHSVPTRQA